jgi:Tol biopolymer transport system component
MSRRQRHRSSSHGGGMPRGAVVSLSAIVVVVLGALAWRAFSTRSPTRDGAPSWSKDGRLVFYSERSNGKADLFVINADGTNLREVNPTSNADEGAPAFSPDGKRIAYDSDLGGNFDIWVVDAYGGIGRPLTRHPGRDVAPAWSPDGSKIAFMSDRSGKGFDVHVMNADGTAVEQITSTGSSWFPQFSPDGRQIAMHVHRDVHVLDLASKALHRLTTDPLNGMYPTWSRDGRLAFMSWRNGRTEIFTMGADGSDQQLLMSMPTGGAIDPRFSPDGTQLAFVHVPEATPDQPQSPNQSRVIYIVDMETRKVRRLSR